MRHHSKLADRPRRDHAPPRSVLMMAATIPPPNSANSWIYHKNFARVVYKLSQPRILAPPPTKTATRTLDRRLCTAATGKSLLHPRDHQRARRRTSLRTQWPTKRARARRIKCALNNESNPPFRSAGSKAAPTASTISSVMSSPGSSACSVKGRRHPCSIQQRLKNQFVVVHEHN